MKKIIKTIIVIAVAIPVLFFGSAFAVAIYDVFLTDNWDNYTKTEEYKLEQKEKEAAKKAKEEAEQKEKEQKEAEKKAKAEAKRKEKEQKEAAKKAKEEAEKKAKAEAERKEEEERLAKDPAFQIQTRGVETIKWRLDAYTDLNEDVIKQEMLYAITEADYSDIEFGDKVRNLNEANHLFADGMIQGCGLHYYPIMYTAEELMDEYYYLIDTFNTVDLGEVEYMKANPYDPYDFLAPIFKQQFGFSTGMYRIVFYTPNNPEHIAKGYVEALQTGRKVYTFDMNIYTGDYNIETAL